MTKAGDKIIEGAKEALAVAKGEIPAASIWVNGHRYVPSEEYDRLRADAATIRREAPDWQPMETAPHGRWVLLDMSYLYPSDTHITEIYTVGCWTDKHEDYCWDCGEDVHHRDAPKGWMDIPKTKLANPPGEQP